MKKNKQKENKINHHPRIMNYLFSQTINDWRKKQSFNLLA
jgi:hypothetical protein